MSNMVIFNTNDGEILEVYPEGGFSVPDYKGRPDVLIDIDMSILKTVPRDHVKVDLKDHFLYEIPQEEKDAKEQEKIDAENAKKSFSDGIKAKFIGLGFTDSEVDAISSGSWRYD